MDLIPPHIAGQWRRAGGKSRRAMNNWIRAALGTRAEKKWIRRYDYWGLRMDVILPYLEDGKP